MDEIEIQGAVNLIKCCARTAMAVPLSQAVELLNQQTREETIMPILDPTQYRDNMEAIQMNRRLAEVFVTFRSELERIARG